MENNNQQTTYPENGNNSSYTNQNYDNQNDNNQNYNNAGYNNPNYNNPNGNYSYYGNPNNNYQMPYPPQMELEEPVGIGEWILTMVIMMIPCVNIIMMFVWAFSKTEKKSKSNYFKANLIVGGVVLALYLVIVIAFVALGIGMAGSAY